MKVHGYNCNVVVIKTHGYNCINFGEIIYILYHECNYNSFANYVWRCYTLFHEHNSCNARLFKHHQITSNIIKLRQTTLNHINIKPHWYIGGAVYDITIHYI